MSVAIEVEENRQKIKILAHLSLYVFYTCNFTREVIDDDPIFFHLESYLDTWKDDYRKQLNPCYILPLDIDIVLLNQITGRTPRKLDVNNYIF